MKRLSTLSSRESRDDSAGFASRIAAWGRDGILAMLFVVQLLAGPTVANAQESTAALSVRGDSLSVSLNSADVAVSLGEGDLLRITAVKQGITERMVPEAMRVGIGKKPVSPVPNGDSYTLGPYGIRLDGASLVISLQGKERFRVTVERMGRSTVRMPILLNQGDAFYGMGQCSKTLALGAQSFTLYNRPSYGDQTYLYVPFFFGSAGDAFLFEAAGNDTFLFRNGKEVTPASASGTLDFFYWQDPAPASLVASFFRLTGSRSLLPRWAYGYIQSRFGYRTEAELRDVVRQFSLDRIPLSAVVLDLYWFARMGDLDWNRAAFPDPAGLVAWLQSKNVRLLSISEPFYTLDSKLYASFAKAGLFATADDGSPRVWNDWWTFGGTGGSIINPIAPGAEQLLGDRYVELARTGVDGFWTDLGEPENVPGDARFGPWSAVEFHQAFNKEWSRLIHDALERAFPGKRPFILSRSGYLGSAGYGVSTWSGDVSASWNGLSAQVPLGLQAGLSGFPYWGSDVGGFVTSGGERELPAPELYYRWQQFGCFTPVYRAHGTGPREPWIYGPEWLDRTRGIIELRYQLLPYIYSTAWQVWSKGLPMMRPLFFLDPTNPRLAAEDSSYLFGDWLLVSPVTKPIEVEQTKNIYLPAGTWYDLLSLAPYQGGKEILYPLTLESLPVFIREGAIIPMDFKGLETYVLVPGRQPTEYVAFSDDGVSESYRTGAGEKLLIRLDAGGFSVSGAERVRDVMIAVPRGLVKLAGLASAQVREEGPYTLVKVSIGPEERRYNF